MTEYAKTTQDQDREKYDLNNDKILMFLKNQESLQFKPGDILIKMVKNYQDEWNAETVSYANSSPRKYMYVFENELGIGYIKAFLTSGKLAERAVCITEFDLSSNKFVLDPEYVDHILIGGDETFAPTNTFKERKKFREKAIANNKKIILPKDSASVFAWVNKLDVGHEFYFGYDIPNMVEQKYRVVAVKYIRMMDMDSYRRDRLIKNFGIKPQDSLKLVTLEVLKHKYRNVGDKEEFSIEDFLRSTITEKEPFPMAEGDR